MTDEPQNLILEHLRVIRAEQDALRAEMNLKIGALAEGMVSMRQQIDTLEAGQNKLRDEVHGMRADLRMIALAVDQHTARLERIEARLNLHDA